MGITPLSMAAFFVVYGQEVGMALQLVDDLKIRDVTVEKNKLNAMLGNIENTPWPCFKNIWEELASIPIVRCPWGCSEFLHKTNDVAFDYFIQKVLGESIDTYSSPIENKYTNGFRLDLTKKNVYILKNPSWVCSPCLAFTVKRGPRLLCCRYHSGKD
jgi:hypothetical protein